MGTFIPFLLKPQIPEKDYPLYFERMMTIFRKGGMLGMEMVSLFQQKISLLHEVEPDNDGYVSAYYNYFEDDVWETTGFSQQGDFGSNKVGYRQFNRVVSAASLLTEQMSEKRTLVDWHGPVTSLGSAAAWLRHILGVPFGLANRLDCWNVYEILHQSNQEWGYPEQPITEKDLKAHLPDNSSFFEATQFARFFEEDYRTITEKMKEVFAERSSTSIPITFPEEMEKLPETLRTLQQLRQEEPSAFIQTVLDYLCEPAEERVNKRMHPPEEQEKPSPEVQAGFVQCEAWLPAALVVKALAEQTESDFWTLWERMNGEAQSGFAYQLCLEMAAGRSGVYLPISTEDYLRVSPDDLLYYLPTPELSEEMSAWLEELQSRYETLLAEGFPLRSGTAFLKDMITTLSAVDRHFGSILMFRDTFYEFIAHSQEQKYQAVWTLYEQIAEEEWDKDRNYKPEWTRYSKAPSRLKMRRFLALLANPTMRQKVFAL